MNTLETQRAASVVCRFTILELRVYVRPSNPLGVRMALDRRHSIRQYRAPASAPVTIKHGGQFVPATLNNVSLSGAFFFTDAPFQAGAEIQVVLMLPREVGLQEDQMVCCQGKIVRVEEQAGKFGIAAEFERMERMPQL